MPCNLVPPFREHVGGSEHTSSRASDAMRADLWVGDAEGLEGDSGDAERLVAMGG